MHLHDPHAGGCLGQERQKHKNFLRSPTFNKELTSNYPLDRAEKLTRLNSRWARKEELPWMGQQCIPVRRVFRRIFANIGSAKATAQMSTHRITKSAIITWNISLCETGARKKDVDLTTKECNLKQKVQFSIAPHPRGYISICVAVQSRKLVNPLHNWKQSKTFLFIWCLKL